MGLFNFFKNKGEKEEEKERYHFPVKFQHYTKEILVTGVNLDQLMALLREELEVTDDPMPLDSFLIEKVVDSQWYHIQCSNEIDFYGFHNLVNWFYKYEGDHAIIKAIGLARHSNKADLSYYIVQDVIEKWGDKLIGVMNNDKSFSVYLPESYEDGGNIMVKDNRLNGVKMSQYLADYGLAEILN